MGSRRKGELANALGISPRAADGFHLFLIRRRARFRGNRDCIGAVLPIDYAGGAECTNGNGQSGFVPVHGRCRFIVVSRTSKRRNGGGSNADHRHTASTDEFGRIKYVVDFPDVGLGKQRQVAKVRELK